MTATHDWVDAPALPGQHAAPRGVEPDVRHRPPPRRDAPPLPASISIDRLHDPVVEALELPVHCRYVETFWLPVLGPTPLWLLRHAAMQTEGGRYEADTVVLGWSLGLGGHKSGSLHNALKRVVDFSCAERVGATTWLMRTHLAPLSRSKLARLPEPLQEAHRRWEMTR